LLALLWRESAQAQGRATACFDLHAIHSDDASAKIRVQLENTGLVRAGHADQYGDAAAINSGVTQVRRQKGEGGVEWAREALISPGKRATSSTISPEN